MRNKYAIVTSNANGVNVKYMSNDDYKLVTNFVEKFNINQNSVLGVVCPEELAVIYDMGNVVRKNADPLGQLLSKPNIGLVFAATNGLMSLFKIMIQEFKLKYKRSSGRYKTNAMNALSAAVIGGHIDIVHVCRSELYDADMSDLALSHEKLDVLLYECPPCCGERIFAIFVDRCKVTNLFEDFERFKSILDAYKDKQDVTRFKDMINKTLVHAVQDKSKYIGIVELLISYGADDYEKPICKAANDNCFDIVRLLLDNVKTNDTNDIDRLKQHAAFGAASVDNFDMFKLYCTETMDLYQVILKTTNVDILDFCIRNGAMSINNDRTSGDKTGGDDKTHDDTDATTNVTTDVVASVMKGSSSMHSKLGTNHDAERVRCIVNHAIDERSNDMIQYLIENGIANDFKKMLKRSIKKSRAEKIGYLLEQADKLGRDDHERNEETRTHNNPYLKQSDYKDLILCAMDVRDYLNDSYGCTFYPSSDESDIDT